MGCEIICIGIPKTIDNDLFGTDNSPGFGSVAKYISISLLEAKIDLKSVFISSTKVFILEVMGRHSGWIAASTAIADIYDNISTIILLPEIKFKKKDFLYHVNKKVEKYGFCCVVVSEGVKSFYEEDLKINNINKVDAFNHKQLGGIAQVISNNIEKCLGLKCHYAISDYLQRSSSHITSKVDIFQAYQIGRIAVKYAEKGFDKKMVTIVRDSNYPYKWHFNAINISEVANREKKIPSSFISKSGFYVTKEFMDYILPLIQGECYPDYSKIGLPEYFKFDI